ncbi:MAG: hypothetical protein HWD58_06500 [Bacteroidota bacterium]|nr:MAG: hypothetical protein HWD58_06500 [Bacteroidota bacterium]
MSNGLLGGTNIVASSFLQSSGNLFNLSINGLRNKDVLRFNQEGYKGLAIDAFGNLVGGALNPNSIGKGSFNEEFTKEMAENFGEKGGKCVETFVDACTDEVGNLNANQVTDSNFPKK